MGRSAEEMVTRLNRMMSGWANYFTLGQVSPAHEAADRHATRRLRQWFGRKHKARSGGYARFLDERLWKRHGLVRLGPKTRYLPWAKMDSPSTVPTWITPPVEVSSVVRESK